MEIPIANPAMSEEDVEFLKRKGKADEATRRLYEGGWTGDIEQMIINDPENRGHLIDYARLLCYGEKAVEPDFLDYKSFLKWLQKNNLGKYFQGRIDHQIRDQEVFYQKFYGKYFRIDRSKIRIDARRLPAIKAGLKAGCSNYALLKVTPEFLSKEEAQMTGAEFFFERLMKPLKEDGFKIWAETGADRWTKLTLAELLHRCNPAEPEEFDPVAFKKDWVAEEIRVITKKGQALKVLPGVVEMVFTSNLADIPSNQVIVNKDGKVVSPEDRSYISVISDNVRLISREEEIVLASQLYAKDKTYLALKTWEWRRDVVDHQDKDAKPPVSVAIADSDDGEFYLHSYNADHSNSSNRWRLAL